MKLRDLKVGKTYVNRDKGLTRRTITGIGLEFRPESKTTMDRPRDFWGVEFTQGDNPDRRRLWIDSFASWAGREVDQP